MSTTRAKKYKNIIKINEVEYEIVDGTQSDGRCFSGSIYYDLHEVVAVEDELNSWIEDYIINPILELETTDCGQFFSWVFFYNYFNNSKKISENMQDIVYIFRLIDLLIKFKKQIYSKSINLNNNIQDALDIDKYVQELMGDFDKVILETFDPTDMVQNLTFQDENKEVDPTDMVQKSSFQDENKEVDTTDMVQKSSFQDETQNFKAYPDEKKEIKEYIENLVNSIYDAYNETIGLIIPNYLSNEYSIDNIDEEAFKITIKEFTEFIIQMINDTFQAICLTLTTINEFNVLVDLYKIYINNLNKKVTKINHENNIKFTTYETTEPNAGPADILVLNNKQIKSIQIIQKQKKREEEEKEDIYVAATFTNLNPDTDAKDLYIYFDGMGHYQPLVPVNPTPETTETPTETTETPGPTETQTETTETP